MNKNVWLATIVVVLVAATIAFRTELLSSLRMQAPPLAPDIRIVVLWIEEAEAAREREEKEVPRRLRDYLAEVFPIARVDLRFLPIDPSDSAAIRGAIEKANPKLVIFANQNFLGALEDWAFETTSFLSPMELAPEMIERQFGHLRSQNRVAFISWYPSSQGKAIEHLLLLTSGRIKRIAAFYDESLIKSGLDVAFREAASRHDLEVQTTVFRDIHDFERLIARARVDYAADALYIPMCNTIVLSGKKVAMLARGTGLPAAYSRGDQVLLGGLISTDAPVDEIWRQTARYAALILRGADASKLEIIGPSRLETTVNLRAAREIGLQVPYELLVEASEIVSE